MRWLTALLALSLSACPMTTPTDDGGTPAKAPTLEALSPTRGSVAGGTVVTLSGANFVEGVVVRFGSAAATLVAFDSAVLIRVRTPAAMAPGPVAVTLTNPDGQAATLPNAFTYDPVGSPAITEALLMNAASIEDTSGADPVTVLTLATVEVPNVTPGAGQGAGVRAQVGFSAVTDRLPTDAEITWRDATYDMDVDGSTAGDKRRDLYRGSLSLAGPGTSTTKTYVLLARFSLDNGQSWSLADRDGFSNGVTPAQLPRVTLRRLGVDWCKLGGEDIAPPPVLSARAGTAGATVYGQVYVADVTNRAGAGAGVGGELGVGAQGTDVAQWRWVPATFNRDTNNVSNDEFQAALPALDAGTYAFAFRFNLGGGAWAYCDADGLVNGFSAAQAGALTVTAPSVDRCALQFPPTVDARQGRPMPTLYGRVFASGVTDQAAPSTTIDMEIGLGVGPFGQWLWLPATYNVKVAGGGEEFEASLLGPAPATYSYAFRARLEQGAWTYCDRDGSDNGFQLAQAGALTSRPFDLDECVLDTPSSAQTTAPNGTTGNVSARVTALTLTEDVGAGAGISMELGYGPTGSTPAGWTTWQPATFDGDDGAADRYRASLQAPAAAGGYDLAYRARLGGGAWRYCDKDGLANGYAAAQAGHLTVASATISKCTLQFVTATSVPSGSPVTAYVRVLVPGVSSAAGLSPGLRAQFGVGTEGDDARSSASWGWASATFNVDIASSGEDELMATFPLAYTGTRAVAARASLDGVSWTYCDSDGSDNGYTVGNQWAVNVTPHTTFAFCNTQHPAVTDAGLGEAVFGRAFLASVTPDAGAPITAELGWGSKVEDPGLAWRWTAGAFNVAVGNDNEYRANLPRDAGSGASYAWRFTLPSGETCFGDLDGSQNGFAGEVGVDPNLGRVR